MDGRYGLCEDGETEGFDVQAGQTWIYPTNLPIRDYQFNIVQTALLHNTMVTLPTGLGKTFIAAVVMYNYFRWYPKGKIIFMAPTRPLVKQQIDACYNIVGIPKEATAELTGSTAKASREDIWLEKRVFFITPQVLQNDLERIVKLAKEIKCLVFDEAHKARGGYAYVEVIKRIAPINGSFRVLALSATPGSYITDVIAVCGSLLISRLEARDEDSLDVSPYVCKRTVETVVVQFDGKLRQVYEDYLKILDRYVRVLVNYRVVQGNCANLTKGRFFCILQEFKSANSINKVAGHSEIVKTLHLCIILYHAFEVLTQHGLRGFMKYFDEHSDKSLIRSIGDIWALVEDVRAYLGPIPNVELLPDGSLPEVPAQTKFGHPKFYRLVEILLGHFKNHGKDGNSGKAIVFCEYKESIAEAYTAMLRHRAVLRPKMFVGQGGISQKQQIAVLDSFRKGTCNVLVSTSVGEEGLDVGEVDLVICFDVSNKSTVRMVQRMGRTGRRRQGKVIILVTEGKEQETLRGVLAQKKNLISSLVKSRELKQELDKQISPRMVPEDIHPSCDKICFTIAKEPKKSKNSDLVSMFSSMANGEQRTFSNRIPSLGGFRALGDRDERVFDAISTKHDRPSADTKILKHLLDYALARRYNLPLSPVKAMANKGNAQKKRQTDIRSMFKRTTSDGEMPELSQADEKVDALVKEITNYFLVAKSEHGCSVCENLFRCDGHVFPKDDGDVFEWRPPNMQLVEAFNLDDLRPDELEEDDELFEEFQEAFILNQSDSPVMTKARTQSFVVDGNESADAMECSTVYSDDPMNDEDDADACIGSALGGEKEEKISMENALNRDDEDVLERCIITENFVDGNERSFLHAMDKFEEQKVSKENSTVRNKESFALSGKKQSVMDKFVVRAIKSSALDNKQKKCSMENVPADRNKESFSRGGEDEEKRTAGDAHVQSFALEDDYEQDAVTPEFGDESDEDGFHDYSITELIFVHEETLRFFRLTSLQDLFEEDADATILCSSSFYANKESPIIQSLEVKVNALTAKKKLLYSEERCARGPVAPQHGGDSQKENTSPILRRPSRRLSSISPDLFDSPEKKSQSPAQRSKNAAAAKETPAKTLLEELDLDDFCDESVADFFKAPPKVADKACGYSAKKKRVMDSSLYEYSFDSEEDFEEVSVKSPATRTTTRSKFFRKRRVLESSFSSSQEEEAAAAAAAGRKRKRLKSNLFDVEAEVSSDARCSADEEDGSDLDRLETSFVNDETVNESVSMYAHYVQTTKSQAVSGKFKIPKKPRKCNNANIYSQTDSHGEDDSYVNDSFCVDSETEEFTQSLSEVEVAEKNYKSKKRNKRRRIIVNSEDSD